MAKQKYTEAKRDSNRRYDAKTYKKKMVYLRIVDDWEIIEDMEKALDEGLTTREWLNKLWANQTK